MILSEIAQLALLLFVGIGAGFINVMAGGGSAITLPILIFLGLNASTANGTNRIAILIQNVSAVSSFKKENFEDFGVSLKLALFTLPGAVLGAILAVKINNELFQKILGIVLIFIAISMVIPKHNASDETSQKNKTSWTVYAAMIFVGFYGGFIQAGVGFILMVSLNKLMKLNLVFVNMHKVFIVLIYNIPALLIFVFTGNVNWKFGFALAAGNAFGAWWAVKLAVKKGDKFIKLILLAVILFMSLKLLSVF